LHEGDFEIKAQHDVQVVGCLVGFDTNERRLNFVDCPVELFHLNAAELLGEALLQLRVVGLPEGPAAPYEIFPQPRLRLMYAKRSTIV